MKKALVILMALAMTFAVFADVPVLDAAVTTFDGSAEIDYVINLDDETTGMVNVAPSTTLEYTFWTGGSKSTEGDGLWGELAISSDATTAAAPGGISVGTAKIHFLDGDFYANANILGPDLSVGGGNYSRAVKDDSDSNLALPSKSVTLTGAAGFVFNFGVADLFDANVSFADNGLKSSDDKKFALKADATLKAVENLDVYGGFAWSQEDTDSAYAARVGYTLALSDTMKLIPTVGIAGKGDAKELGANVFLSWGATYLEPGFASFSNSVTNVVNDTGDGISVTATSTDLETFDIVAGIYDSVFVSGLKAGVQVETSTAENATTTIDAAAAYGTAFDIWNFNANAGAKIKMANETTMGFLYGASIDTDAIIQNTTLKAAYVGEKAADIGGADLKGTITFSAKIHF